MNRKRFQLKNSHKNPVRYIFLWIYITLIRLCHDNKHVKVFTPKRKIFKKKLLQLASQVFLFGPLCFMLKVWTQKCSQTFLYWLSVLTIFSKISISDILFPGVLKWFPVAFSKCLFTTCPYVLQICLEGSINKTI